jgi:hypothetical protein
MWRVLKFGSVRWSLISPSIFTMLSMVFFAPIDLSMSYPTLRDMYDDYGRPKHATTVAAAVDVSALLASSATHPDAPPGSVGGDGNDSDSTDSWESPLGSPVLGPQAPAPFHSPLSLDNELRRRIRRTGSSSSALASISGLSRRYDRVPSHDPTVESFKPWTTNHELWVAGLSGMIAAATGGASVAYLALSPTRISYDTGSTTNLASLASLFINIITFFVGSSVVSIFPPFHVGGLTFYAGLGYFLDGVFAERLMLSWLEYAMVWLIVLFSFLFGMIQAVGLGLCLAIMAFIVKYSGAFNHLWSSSPIPSLVLCLLRKHRWLQEYRMNPTFTHQTFSHACPSPARLLRAPRGQVPISYARSALQSTMACTPTRDHNPSLATSINTRPT